MEVQQPPTTTSEELEQMIDEMRSHLQQGFSLLESVWARCLGNRELAASIDDPDEFVEIVEAAEKTGEIARDINSIATTGKSFIDGFTKS
ncbi:MAG: hypothetical protein HY913_04210 [Desulfomonile tiedjei]|nr:hypothetical protein [Desulfomonile tiedjei]